VAAGDVRAKGGIVSEHGPACGFEIEVASVEEFLRLLKEREDESADQDGRGATRRAIFVAQMMDRRPSNYAFPLIRRYVVAAFAYGSDRVSYTRTTSNAVELPETVEKTEDRQQEAYEEVRAEIERGLRELALRVPIHEGFLRHPADADGRR
jgi:hypothetical protein